MVWVAIDLGGILQKDPDREVERWMPRLPFKKEKLRDLNHAWRKRSGKLVGNFFGSDN